jgi:hypothetical protein
LGAALGLAIAILISRRLPFRAAAGQLPGYAAVLGFDPRASALRFLLAMVLPLLGGAVAWRIARPRTWARLGMAAERQGASSPREIARQPRILIPAVAGHALSAWTFLVGPLGSHGLATLTLFALLLAASLVLAAALGGGRPYEGVGYLGAACPVLPFAFLGPRPAAFWLSVGLATYALPALARCGAIVRPGVARLSRALVVVLLLPGSVTAMAAAASMRTPRIASVFEDGHGLLPASEYMRGELPYRDIVPGHGLVSDGLLALAQLRLFGDDYAGLKRGEKISGALFWPALYAVGYAATGSAAVAYGGLLLSFLFGPQYDLFRATASLWTLALAIYASRSRKPRAWLACGIALPLCFCVAVEFATYAAGAVGVALWVARGRRRDNLRQLCVGALISGAAIALVLAGLGVLAGFLSTTFVFLPSLLPAYALGFPKVALAGGGPQPWSALRDETLLLYGFVAISVVLLGAWLPRAPRVGPRGRSVLPICAWTALSMLSVLERRHTGYGALIIPMGLLLMARWLRGRSAWTSPLSWLPAAALGLLAWLRRPVWLFVTIADSIANSRPPPGLEALSEPPRAHGALFSTEDAAIVVATGEALRRGGFRETDTWLDFSSMPGLYYLFDRDCPIRYYEVGFFESEKAQREVIDAVERNPRVRGVLLGSHWFGSIDGVTNAVRAPLVDAFIREKFRPFYRKGDIELWLRKDVSEGRPEKPVSSPP